METQERPTPQISSVRVNLRGDAGTGQRGPQEVTPSLPGRASLRCLGGQRAHAGTPSVLSTAAGSVALKYRLF